MSLGMCIHHIVIKLFIIQQGIVTGNRMNMLICISMGNSTMYLYIVLYIDAGLVK